MVCEDTSPTHGRQGQQAEAVGCRGKCWANNAKCYGGLTTAVSQQLYSGSLWSTASQGLLGPAPVQLPAGARTHSPCSGPICTALANQSSVATRAPAGSAFSPAVLTGIPLATDNPLLFLFALIFLKAPDTYFSLFSSFSYSIQLQACQCGENLLFLLFGDTN